MAGGTFSGIKFIPGLKKRWGQHSTQSVPYRLPTCRILCGSS